MAKEQVTYQKPLPIIEVESREYWAGCREGKLLLQKCQDCGKVQFYPRTICANCFSTNLTWIQSSGKGTVYAYSVVRRAPSKRLLMTCLTSSP